MRDTSPCAQLVEGHPGEPGEPIISGLIHEGERQNSIPHSGSHSVERHASLLQALHPTRPEHVTRGERVLSIWRQDPELNQTVNVVGVDSSPLGDLLP